MRRRPFLAWLGWLATLGWAFVTAGCGSSGGGAAGNGLPNGPPAPPIVSTGLVNVAVTDGPTTAFDHVWITLSEIRFHASDVVGAGDAGWVAFPLVAPVTVDLAALCNGALASFFNNLELPAGTYRQIRVFAVDASDPLADSARAQGILYNAQVDWTDAQGNSHSSPLEIASPQQGIGVIGTFSVADSATLNLALDFDVGHDVVALNQGAAFILKPLLHAYDLARAGAVFGRIDPTDLCSNGPAANCAYDLVVKAEEIHASGAYHVAGRYTTVRADGSFMLYPVAVPAGQPASTIDVLVRGRNMETILVRNVFVQAGSSPRSPTLISTTNLPLTLGTEYAANASAAVAPSGAWIDFAQTLSATGRAEVPYEVRHRQLDPLTGMPFEDIALSTGPLHVGDYVAAGSPVLAANAPVEGSGGFRVFADGLGYARAEATNSPLTPPAGAGPALFTMPALPVDATRFSSDSISGTVLQATPNQYDRGELVAAWMGSIVTALPLDAVLAANSGTGGSYLLANVPGGAPLSPVPSARYDLYVRVWNSADPLATFKRIEVNGGADLRTGSASGVNVTLN